jgi:hypothetical protein
MGAVGPFLGGLADVEGGIVLAVMARARHRHGADRRAQIAESVRTWRERVLG